MECCLLDQLEAMYYQRTSHAFSPTMTISIAGAGGKTSIHQQLVTDWKQKDRRGICIGTTTTQMFYPEDDGLYDEILTYPFDHQIDDGSLFLYWEHNPLTHKIKGLSLSQLDELKTLPSVTLIITESDGARGRSLKAPNQEEPLHPLASDMVIGVIGLSSYGKPISEEVVHRLPFFRNIIDTQHPIDARTYIDLILHPQGLFKHAPENALKILILNQADILDDRDQKLIIERLSEENLPIDGILMTSLSRDFILYHSRSIRQRSFT